MAKKKDNIGDQLNKARQENRTLAFEFLNLKFNDRYPTAIMVVRTFSRPSLYNFNIRRYRHFTLANIMAFCPT